MNPLNQPPPGASAPPPSKAAILSRRKWRWLKVAGILSIIGCTLVAAAPFLIRPRCCRGPHVEAVSNARQMGLALFEFETEYSSFPDASTITAVSEHMGSSIPMGTTTSNGFFRQLFAGGIVASESMFYAGTHGTRKGDNLFGGSDTLEKGECGFTYLLGAKTTCRPDRPIVVAPMIPGSDRFDQKTFAGMAVILRVDNSVTSIPIDKHGHVIFEGRNLMDPHHPVWQGNAPSIAWPDL